METLKKHGLIGFIVLMLFGGGVAVSDNLGGRTGAHTERGCTPQSTTSVTIGNQASTDVVSANSNRSFVRIQQVSAATNTVTFNFDSGTAAVDGVGHLEFNVLNSGSTTPKHIDFGLKTDFPYLGTVTAITNTGSTTVLVTDCRYSL